MKTFFVWSCLLLGINGTAGAAPGDEIYTRPGTLVPADGTRLNLYCMGNGSPAVVFDSGWEDWAPVWTIVQPEVAKWTRACSYDRAGAGFSDPGPLPRTSVRIADELRSALHNGGIKGPYILVGHAFGGDNVRTFAARHPGEVAGLVLVEADVTSSPEERRGQARLIASLRECRDAIAAGKPLPALPGRPARTCAQQFFRGLPEAMWSPELNAKLLELAQTKLAMYDAYGSPRGSPHSSHSVTVSGSSGSSMVVTTSTNGTSATIAAKRSGRRFATAPMSSPPALPPRATRRPGAV